MLEKWASEQGNVGADWKLICPLYI